MRWLPSVLALTCFGVPGSRLLADEVDATTATIQSRLASAEYCATQTADGTLDVILHVYTAEQHRIYVDMRNKYLDERRARAESHELLRRRSTPRRWVLTSRLCRVVSVGQDYIEVEEIIDPEGTTLIPFSRLARIIFVKPIEDESSE